MVSIEVPDLPVSRQELTLDNVPYRLIMAWNERAASWTLSLEDRDGNPLLTGQRVVQNVDLLAGQHYRAIPAGVLIVPQIDATMPSLVREDLPAGRAQLVYLSEADLGR